MTVLPASLREVLIDAVGRTLLHAVWQAALVAGLTAIALALMRRRSPRARYAVACGGLALCAALPFLTWRLGFNDVTRTSRMTVLESVDRAVGLPTVFDAANWLVPAFALLWLAGVVVLLTRLVRQWLGARQLRRAATSPAPPELDAALARLAARMAIRRGVDLRATDRVSVPMVLGWRRPMVLLPPSACRTLSTAQVEAVLAHELAHVRARDYLVNLLQVVVDALLFFHPAARWLSHQVRREREFSCDDAAIADGRDRVVYARALAALEESRCDPMAVAASASAGPLVDRIARLLGRSAPSAGLARRVVAASMVLVLALAAVASLVVLPPGFGKGMRPRTRRPPAGREMVAPSGGLPMKSPEPTFERQPGR